MTRAHFLEAAARSPPPGPAARGPAATARTTPPSSRARDPNITGRRVRQHAAPSPKMLRRDLGVRGAADVEQQARVIRLRRPSPGRRPGVRTAASRTACSAARARDASPCRGRSPDDSAAITSAAQIRSPPGDGAPDTPRQYPAPQSRSNRRGAPDPFARTLTRQAGCIEANQRRTRRRSRVGAGVSAIKAETPAKDDERASSRACCSVLLCARSAQRLWSSESADERSRGSVVAPEFRFRLAPALRQACDGVLLCARNESRAAVDAEYRVALREGGCLWRQSRSDALTGIIGARRAWTVSMISALSMPCR